MTCDAGWVSSDRAVIPAWVVPDVLSVADAHRMTYRIFGDERGRDRPARVRAGGAAAAIDWVTGGQPAPITERVEVDRDIAWAEWRLAGCIERDRPMLWGEVEPREPVIRDRTWAVGAGDALGWLLGAFSRPPVPLPRRLPDGSVPSAEHLYRERLALMPHTMWTPEQRQEAWQHAARDAQRYRSLARLADPI
ncbi:hypothetical protein BJF78_36225 [Pseudonocardia sp. CNS-139]|nr:hypothetical protein BJF78_36225 [Pseudonocardia sp. CNS-139]